MKNRLQSLWNEVLPEGGTSPQPDPETVRRRVRAAVGGGRPRRRALAYALACLALVLLIGAAAAAGVLPLPDFNALSVFYNWDHDDPEAEALVDTQPITVSNELFTVTITSILADENILYLTVTTQAKTPWAERYLDQDGLCPLAFRLEYLSPSRNPGAAATHFLPYDSATKSRSVEMEYGMPEDGRLALHVFDPMGGPCKEGTCPGGDCRVEFTVKQAETRTLSICADGEALYMGRRPERHPATVPVRLIQAHVSPLGLRLDYLGPEEGSETNYVPAVRFLWTDGTVSTMEQLGVHLSSGSGSGDTGGTFEWEKQLVFDSVQDLEKLEALVFENVAYPLDGGEPYGINVDALPGPHSEG